MERPDIAAVRISEAQLAALCDRVEELEAALAKAVGVIESDGVYLSRGYDHPASKVLRECVEVLPARLWPDQYKASLGVEEAEHGA
jgi:uncharacterized protein (UPF0335 family)